MLEIDVYNLDRSYWKVKDKEWVATRKAEWARIERWVSFDRLKGEAKILEQYFLRGKTPDWGVFKADKFKNQKMLLDAMSLLWLHPSNDVDVLRSLFKGYVEHSDVRPVDIATGLAHFLECEFTRSTMPVKSLDAYDFTYMGKKNKVLFDAMYGDIEFLTTIPDLFREKVRKGIFTKFEKNFYVSQGYINLLNASLWLNKASYIEEINNDSLFQYEDVLEYIYQCCLNDSDYFKDLHPDGVPSFHRLCTRVYEANEKHPADSIYANSAAYLCKMFDEREFAPEFKKMWLDVKAGKIEVEDAWER